jgi:N6-adenosine-specific RNA methylase IME4
MQIFGGLYMGKRYSIILSDVPHSYQNWSEKKNGAAKSHYKCLSTADLCALPVEKIAEDNSVLLFWTGFPKLIESLEIIKAWGFEYKTTAFVWNKTYADGHPYCGLGFYTRSGSEACLLATRGKPLKRMSHGVRQIISAPVKKPHSSKPYIVRDKIVELFGEQTRIELFARECMPGWYAIGNEIDGKDIRDSLNGIINDA